MGFFLWKRLVKGLSIFKNLCSTSPLARLSRCHFPIYLKGLTPFFSHPVRITCWLSPFTHSHLKCLAIISVLGAVRTVKENLQFPAVWRSNVWWFDGERLTNGRLTSHKRSPLFSSSSRQRSYALVVSFSVLRWSWTFRRKRNLFLRFVFRHCASGCHRSIFVEAEVRSVCARSCCKHTHRSQNGQTLFSAPSVTSSPMGTLGRFTRRINLVASPKKARSSACLGASIWQQNVSFCVVYRLLISLFDWSVHIHRVLIRM